MEIITKGWPNDNQVFLAESTMTYWQNPDCTEDRDGEPQSITFSTRDNGEAKFLNIKTENWSFTYDEITQLIKDFCSRNGYNICDND